MQKLFWNIVAMSAFGVLLGAAAGCTRTGEDTPEPPEYVAQSSDQSYILQTVGAMHTTVMGGERDAKIELATLADKPQLNAVGPMTGLSGEITIINGRPSLATVGADGTVKTTTSFETGAPFLVWAEVANWQEETLPASVRSVADLEAYLTKRGGEKGLTEAFPFTLTGRAENVGFHVLNADPEASYPAGMDAHKQIQVHFDSGPAEVRLVGFYSTTHQGVFIHRGSFTHIHFQTADNALSGHVESVDFGSGTLVLALPE